MNLIVCMLTDRLTTFPDKNKINENQIRNSGQVNDLIKKIVTTFTIRSFLCVMLCKFILSERKFCNLGIFSLN